jgi:tetratricopeptide (TPR) repeat protein
MRTPLSSIPLAILTLALLGAGCAGPQKAELVLQGDRQMAVQDFASAAQSYRLAQAQQAADDTSLRLATALIRSGKHNEALVELDKVKQDSGKSLYLKALCHVALNDVPNAERHIEQALQATPNDSLTLALLGQVKFLQKEYARSAEAYQDALANCSDETMRTKLHYNLAMSQLSAGRFKQADDTFKLYLVKQRFVTAEDNRTAGAIAYAAGDKDRAFRHWKNLGRKEQQQILNTIADEPQPAATLAINR